jgi:hypothetical protein
MDFKYTKGYLHADDLPWECREYLPGSENVNDVAMSRFVQGPSESWLFAVFATDTDFSVITLEDQSGPYANTLSGYCTLPGGFSKITIIGHYIYAVSKADATRLYRLSILDLNGGDSAADLQIFLITPDPIADIHGDLVGENEFLYYTTSTNKRLYVRDISSPQQFSTSIEGQGAGLLPKGQWEGNLYWTSGPFLYVHYSPQQISVDNFLPHMSYGCVSDDFTGNTIDVAKWGIVNEGAMASCFSQSEALVFDTQAFMSGDARAQAIYKSACVGDIGVQMKMNVSNWPTVIGTQNVGVALEMVSPDLKLAYRIILGRKPISGDASNQHYLRFEVERQGVIVYEVELYNSGDEQSIKLERRPGETGGKLIKFAREVLPGGWGTWYYQDDHGDDTPLIPRIVVFNDTGQSLSGTINDFQPSFQSPHIYTLMPDEEATCVAVSPALAGGGRTIALGYNGGGGFIQTNESDEGGSSEAGAKVSAPITPPGAGLGVEILSSGNPVAACVSSDGMGIMFGGDGGVTHVDAMDTATPAKLRHYTTAWDHAQPLTWIDVRALDYHETGFVYGTAVSGHFGGDPYDPYNPYDPSYGIYQGSGGGGYVISDFDAPAGSGAFARARHENEIVTGAGLPAPLPEDFLHGHVERRINGGDWHRLKADGWMVIGGDDWDHQSDVAFLRDENLGDIGVVIQEENLEPGQYEYRWVFHDEAGNEGYQYPETAYENPAEYIDSPLLSAFSIDSGVSPTIERGVICRVSGHSGVQSLSETHHIHQVRFWNEGESESDSPWRKYDSTRQYPHRLSAGSGLKTVYARARHTCEQESDVVSATILYIEADEEADAESGRENIMICHGEAGGYNFTGDGASVAASSAHPDFPAGHALQNDLGCPWKSDGLGVFTNHTSYYSFEAMLTFDLGISKKIEILGILGHNFAQVYDGVSPINDFCVEWQWASDPSFLWNFGSVDISDLRNSAEILHRPQISHRYWRLRMFLKTSIRPLFSPFGLAWSIGRIVINEQALCFCPQYNFDDDIRLEHRDPSSVALTAGQARRVVELESYRKLEMNFKGLTTEQISPFETIWKRQRQLRPVLAIIDPALISKGEQAPVAQSIGDNPAVYGYLGERLRLSGAGWNRLNLAMSVTESVG